MAALPNIGGALCSTPQSLADAHCGHNWKIQKGDITCQHIDYVAMCC